MDSSDSDEDYSEDDELDDSEFSYYGNDEDEDEDEDDDDDEDDEEEDDEVVIGASDDDDDDDEDASDSEYFLNDDDDDADEVDDEEEEHEFEEDDGIPRQIDDNQGLPALEHAPIEPDEISQSTDGPFSRQSTPDVSSSNRLAADASADLSAEGAKNGQEIPNLDAPDLDVEATDDSVPPPLISSLPGEMDKMKIYDPSEPSADLPANGSVDNGRGVENKGQ